MNLTMIDQNEHVLKNATNYMESRETGLTFNPSSFCEAMDFSKAFCFSSLTVCFVFRALLLIGKNAVTFCCLSLVVSFICFTFKL